MTVVQLPTCTRPIAKDGCACRRRISSRWTKTGRHRGPHAATPVSGDSATSPRDHPGDDGSVTQKAGGLQDGTAPLAAARYQTRQDRTASRSTPCGCYSRTKKETVTFAGSCRQTKLEVRGGLCWKTSQQPGGRPDGRRMLQKSPRTSRSATNPPVSPDGVHDPGSTRDIDRSHACGGACM